MLDQRTYGSSSLLSPKMKDFQGPAIVVHNNAVFTPRDFENLSRIGQGAKLERLATTGRFGLGFNCCYNYTDLPSILRCGWLCVVWCRLLVGCCSRPQFLAAPVPTRW